MTATRIAPFVTLHDVIHDGDAARLAEGQLMTPQMLIDLNGRFWEDRFQPRSCRRGC